MSASTRLMSRFTEGARVRMTPSGISRDLLSGPHNKPRTGKVVGFSLCGKFVRVRRKGEKVAGSYYPYSWEVSA